MVCIRKYDRQSNQDPDTDQVQRHFGTVLAKAPHCATCPLHLLLDLDSTSRSLDLLTGCANRALYHFSDVIAGEDPANPHTHTWNAGVVTTQPTCTEAGVSTIR